MIQITYGDSPTQYVGEESLEFRKLDEKVRNLPLGESITYTALSGTVVSATHLSYELAVEKVEQLSEKLDELGERKKRHRIEVGCGGYEYEKEYYELEKKEDKVLDLIIKLDGYAYDLYHNKNKPCSQQ